MFSIKNKFVKFKKISLVEIDNGLGLKVTLCSYAASIYKVELHGKTITYASENSRFQDLTPHNLGLKNIFEKLLI